MPMNIKATMSSRFMRHMRFLWLLVEGPWKWQVLQRWILRAIQSHRHTNWTTDCFISMIKTGANSWHLLALLPQAEEGRDTAPQLTSRQENQITWDNFLWYLPIMNILHSFIGNCTIWLLQAQILQCTSANWSLSEENDQIHHYAVF